MSAARACGGWNVRTAGAGGRQRLARGTMETAWRFTRLSGVEVYGVCVRRVSDGGGLQARESCVDGVAPTAV